MNALARKLQDLHYRNFGFIVKALGGLNTPERSYALAQLIGGLRTRFGYIGAGWSRDIYLNTIRTIFPEISKRDADDLLTAYWINHQKRFVELFFATELTPDNLGKLVEFDGLEQLDSALEQGRGVILPVPHIGNERLHHIALAVKGYPMAVISSKYEDHGKFAKKIKLDASKRFHDVGHPGDAFWLLKALKRNSILQIASDAEADSNAVIVSFLGHELLLPTGWVRLAHKTGAVVFPSVLLRQDDNRHRLIIKPEFKIETDSERKISLQANVQRYMDIVAEIYKERPDLIDWMSLTVRMEEMRWSKVQQQ